MSRLDEAIANTAYVLDCLMTLREIHESGCCNDCRMKAHCMYKPKPGKLVRYNCPFYEGKAEDDHS